MKYRRYGKDGPEVSVLGYGVMRLPEADASDPLGKVDFDKGVPLLLEAMEAGVNFFDSHHLYHSGDSEPAIGKALKQWKGQKIYVQTKTPFYNDKPMDYFKELLEKALKNLGVDRIDYLLFHGMEKKMFDAKGKMFFEFTDWAIKEGLLWKRGFSSHDKVENIKSFIDTGEFSCMLVSYNWLNQYAYETIAHAAEKGMGVSIMNPVLGGGLAANTPELMDLLPGAKTSAEIALRWAFDTPGVTTALSGMSNSQQIQENVQIADRNIYMTPDERKVMSEKLEAIKNRSEWFCSYCGYCMPCPEGVWIPDNFRLYQDTKIFGLMEFGRTIWKNLQKHPEGDISALSCKKCGKCLVKCPNKIDIPERMQDVIELFEEETA